jgi:hypothetical protein
MTVAALGLVPSPRLIAREPGQFDRRDAAS